MSSKTAQKKELKVEGKSEKYFAIENAANFNKDTVIVGSFDRLNNKPSLNSVEAEIRPGLGGVGGRVRTTAESTRPA